MILLDIDGILTKSNLLYFILPRIRINWNHWGIIELINKMNVRGYKKVYLIAKAFF